MGYKFRLGLIFVLLIVFGISALYSFSRDSLAMSKGMPDFNTMKASDFEDGGFVQGTVYELLDEFAYMEEYEETFGIRHNERVSAHYYIMPLYSSYDEEYPQYIAVCLRNVGMVSTAEQMIQETWDYYDYGTEPDEWTELPITGKVSHLRGDLLDYFYEWIMYGEESTDKADFSQYVVPYVITYYEPGGASTVLIAGIVMLVIGIAGTAVMIAMAIRSKREPESVPAPTMMPSYPVSPASPSSSGYAPVNSPDPLPPLPTASYPAVGNQTSSGFSAGMDEIDTSSLSTGMDEPDTRSLGIGIDDDDPASL